MRFRLVDADCYRAAAMTTAVSRILMTDTDNGSETRVAAMKH